MSAPNTTRPPSCVCEERDWLRWSDDMPDYAAPCDGFRRSMLDRSRCGRCGHLVDCHADEAQPDYRRDVRQLRDERAGR